MKRGRERRKIKINKKLEGEIQRPYHINTE